MNEEQVEITEIWEYDKENNSAGKMVGMFANGYPLELQEGYCAEVRFIPKIEVDNIKRKTNNN